MEEGVEGLPWAQRRKEKIARWLGISKYTAGMTWLCSKDFGLASRLAAQLAHDFHLSSLRRPSSLSKISPRLYMASPRPGMPLSNPSSPDLSHLFPSLHRQL